MDLALYAPGLGYYNSGTHKIGKEGDFVTAPEISSLFTKCVAKQFHQVLSFLGSSACILEIGAGSGIFARDVLLELEDLGALPKRYYILEVSADLRARQKQQFIDSCPDLLPHISWLSSLPTDFTGVIFANEVLDAMPTHCFQIGSNEINERCVSWEKNKFNWLATPATNKELLEKVSALKQQYSLPVGYESEINLIHGAWIRSLADILKKGLILLFDYGYGRSEYYHPDRTSGTLMCYYQHHKNDDPFKYVGLQDITAHVDFTTIVENAVHSHLTLAGYTTQASFLLSSGLLDIAAKKELSPEKLYQQNQDIKRLTLPSQMGELVKVMGLAKDVDLDWVGFSMHDRKRDL